MNEGSTPTRSLSPEARSVKPRRLICKAETENISNRCYWDTRNVDLVYTSAHSTTSIGYQTAFDTYHGEGIMGSAVKSIPAKHLLKQLLVNSR